MDNIGSTLRENILEANVTISTDHGMGLFSLDFGKAPLDIDVTPMDNSRTKCHTHIKSLTDIPR